MKYQLLFLILSMLLLAGSCSKDKLNNINSSTLEGEWELYESYSGMMPFTTHRSPNGNRIQFTAATYKYFVNGNLADEGSYHLAIEAATDLNSCSLLPLPDSPNTIIFHGILSKSFYELQNGKLKVWSGCFPLDGGYSIYKKIKDYKDTDEL